MEDVPLNSHFRFNVLLSLNSFRKSRPEVFTAWGYVDFYTYFLVNDKFDRAAFENKIPAFLALLVVSVLVALVAGIPLPDVVKTVTEGMGGTLGSVAILVGLGAMLGKMIEISGGAQSLAGRFTQLLGPRRVIAALLRAGRDQGNGPWDHRRGQQLVLLRRRQRLHVKSMRH